MKINIEPYITSLQTIKLDPKLIMANNILQMSRMELEKKIEEELVENPALEIEENTVERKCPTCQIILKEKFCPVCGKMLSDKPEDDIPEKIIEHDDYIEEIEYLSRSFIDKYRDNEHEELLEKIVFTENLREYLYINLPLVIDRKTDFLVAKYLINYIDEDGYLRYESSDIIKKFSINIEKLEDIIKLIQSLDPPGIGARNLKECITIQLKSLDTFVPPLVWELLSDRYWNDFSHRRFTALSESLQLSIEEIRHAAEFIKNNVNPYPGRNFNKIALKNQSGKIIPDVIIKKNNNNLEVEIVSDNYTGFRINRLYKNLYQDIKKNKHKYSVNEIEHTKNYFLRAKTFIENLYQRRETILKVTKKIIEIQRDFFYYGISHLKPLTRIQVAEAIGMHDSTVSRATKDKFVQLPSGKIVNFDFFFDSSLPVKEEIKAIMESENKNNPLSDKEIVEILFKEKGINLARRTIAKYREEMNIPSSRDRKYSY